MRLRSRQSGGGGGGGGGGGNDASCWQHCRRRLYCGMVVAVIVIVIVIVCRVSCWQWSVLCRLETTSGEILQTSRVPLFNSGASFCPRNSSVRVRSRQGGQTLQRHTRIRAVNIVSQPVPEVGFARP